MTKQTLKLADDLFPALRARRKKATVRNGHRDIALGPLVFEATNGGCADEEVEVHTVTTTTFDQLRDEHAKLDGCSSADELRAALRRFYPDLTAGSPVTVIEFD